MTHAGRRHAALATLLGNGTTVVITIAQAFLLVPLCLKYLGASLYGSWLGASELLIWIQLFDFGIPNLLTQRVGAALGRDGGAEAGRWIGTGLLTLVGVGATLGTIGFVIAPAVVGWAEVPSADASMFTQAFRMGVLGSAMLLLFNGVLGAARGAQRTGLVNGVLVGGAITGFVTSVVLLLTGWGLWALAWGVLARALVSCIGGVLFLITLYRQAGTVRLRPAASELRQIAGLAPAMASGGAGYLLANHSEILLVTTVFGPVPAAIYALTRRAVDGIRSLLDSIAWAVYGGFAHLVTADRTRARPVLHEILWSRLSIACLCGAVYLAINQPFVTLLYGEDQFGGLWLTTAFALQMVLGGQVFLANFLFRAAGHVHEGSWWLAAEGALRLAAMALGLYAAGLVGAPMAATITSAMLLAVTVRRLDGILPQHPDAAAFDRRLSHHAAPAAVLAAGLAIAYVGVPAAWSVVGLTALLLFVLGGALLVHLQPAGIGRTFVRSWTRL